LLIRLDYLYILNLEINYLIICYLAARSLEEKIWFGTCENLSPVLFKIEIKMF